MNFRTAGAVATLLLGVAGAADRATAQYYPPPQAYPPQTYPPAQNYPPYRPAPALEEDDDARFYDPPMVQRRPLPPPSAAGPQAAEALPGASVRSGRGAPVYPEEEVELLPPPPGYIYREGPRGYELHIDPGTRLARPNYATPPSVSPALPPAAGAQPGLPAASEQDAVRPPLSIGPGQVAPGPTGVIRGDARMVALPPDVRPETGPVKELPPQFRRTLVDYRTKEPAGTLIVDTQNTYLYLVLGNGKAMRYGIGVGREGFTWNGTEKVSRVAEWPDWHPPEEMIDRQPYLPRFMAGGEGNPLGARALYLGKTVYRIHGTNQPSTIGTFVSSGCIRLTNEDIMDLYSRVKVGTRVVVLPGKAPATAAATPIAPPGALKPPGAPPVTTAPLGPPPSAMAR
jgi:lipoprotein-anchoring transpeptidase ErfK/SrfK